MVVDKSDLEERMDVEIWTKKVNAMDNVINGPYTRYDPAAPDDEKKKSTLDLFIISKQLERHVDYLFIDKERNYTPYHPTKKKTVYTDHYGCVLVLKNLNKKNQLHFPRSRTVWDTNKNDGWSKYKELTDLND